MKHAMLAALSGAMLLAGTSTASAHYEYQMVVNRVVITISCFRGPSTQVIWDRPNPIFIDSLVAAGYTFPEAHAIAERVCRDPATVGSSQGIIAAMYRIIEQNPPRR